MKRIPKVLILGLFAMILLSGCERDPSTLLTDGTWKFSNMTTNSEDPDIVSLVAFGKAFMTDATLVFNGDGTYIIDSPLTEDPSTGTWSLVGDDQLIMDPDDMSASTANIEKLSKDELKYIETFSDEGGNPYSVTTSWVR